MPKYTVVKPFRGPDGRDLQAGDPVELTERQAKYLLLGGKIQAPGKPAAPKPSAAAPAAADKPKEK